MNVLPVTLPVTDVRAGASGLKSTAICTNIVDLKDELEIRKNARRYGCFRTTSMVRVSANTGFAGSLEWMLMTFRRGPLSESCSRAP